MSPDSLPRNAAFTLSPDGARGALSGEVTLDRAQALVGGWVQLVSTPEGAQVLLNEEGKLQSLPFNQEADELVKNAGLHPADYVCGTAVVLTGTRRWR